MSIHYKERQEEWISNLNGTSITEVTTVLQVIPLSLWFYTETMCLFIVFGLTTSDYRLGAIYEFIVEFMVLVLPILICFTYTEYTLGICISLVILSAGISLVNRSRASKSLINCTRRIKKLPKVVKARFISCFRGQMMISTCVAILGVDFSVFPRRFAKTETYGTSVMDMGVGLFVLSAGLTSRYARGLKDSNFFEDSWKSYVIRIFGPVAPVILLGFLRLLTMKSVDYQEHASEYGVHWNFYFTLAAVSLSFSILQSIAKALVTFPAACIYIFSYQYFLQNGLSEYIIKAPRTNFVSQNREGLCSWIGYLSLFILSASLSRKWIFLADTRGQPAVHFKGLFFALCTTSAATFYTSSFITLPSRRMVNLPYVAWVLAEALLIIFFESLTEFICVIPPRCPQLLQSISDNQLKVFFVANLLTGAVNLTINTLNASPSVGLSILVFYMVLVCLFARTLDGWS